MEPFPLLTALSKLEQLENIRFDSINNKLQLVSAQLDALNLNAHHLHSKFDNFGEKIQQVNTKLDEFSNKITVLDEKAVSVQSFTNDLCNNSSTSNVAISGGHIKTKHCTFKSMLQAW
jgi:predicted  nucleic acid-binding Zn-ribbon protein